MTVCATALIKIQTEFHFYNELCDNATTDWTLVEHHKHGVLISAEAGEIYNHLVLVYDFISSLK